MNALSEWNAFICRRPTVATKVKVTEIDSVQSQICSSLPWTEEPVGYSPWGCKESETTELLHFHPVMNSFLMTTPRKVQEISCLFRTPWIPWMEEPCGLQSMGSLRGRHDWATSLSLFTFMHWRRKTHSSILAWKIPWTEEPVGYSPWGLKEPDTTERLHFHSISTLSLHCLIF